MASRMPSTSMITPAEKIITQTPIREEWSRTFLTRESSWTRADMLALTDRALCPQKKRKPPLSTRAEVMAGYHERIALAG